jgi:hypothetical protein
VRYPHPRLKGQRAGPLTMTSLSLRAAPNREREIGALKTHRPGDIGLAVGGAREGGFSGAAPSAGAAGATFGSAAGGGSSLLRGGLTQLRTQCPGTHRPERVW